MNCIRCGRPVSADETGLTRKIVNRGATEFFCYGCLAEHFKVSVDDLKEAVEHFRKTGCTLFAPRAVTQEQPCKPSDGSA